MRLRALRVRDVGHFTQGAAVEGLTGGLDVLLAPNEAGKSTMFRALEAVFFERHTAASKTVKDLTPHQGGAPLIEADFDVGDVSWRITKQFGRGKKSLLRRMDGRDPELRGPDADDALARVLGLHDGRPGRLGFLWVGQGQALAPLAPDERRGEAKAFQQIVEREVASLTSGSLLRPVREAAAADLALLVTAATRRPKAQGPLDIAIRKRDEVVARLAAARTAQSEAEARRMKLANLKSRRLELAAPERLAAASAALEHATKAHNGAVKLNRLLLDAQRRVHDVQSAAEAAERKASDFKSKLDECAALETALTQAGMRLAEVERALGERRLHIASLEQAGEVLRLEEQSTQDALRLAGQRAALAQTRAQLAARRETLSAAREIEARMVAGAAAAVGPDVSDSDVDRLEAASRKLAHAEASLAGAAPRVTIEYIMGGMPVLIGGRAAPAGELPVIHGSLRLDIPGVGAITVEAAASADREQYAAVRAEAAASLSQGLAELALSSLDDVRAHHAAAKARAALRETAVARLSGLAPRGAAALAAEVDALQAQVDAAPDRDASMEPSVTESSLAAIRARLDDLRASYRSCQKEIEQHGGSMGREKAIIEASQARMDDLAAVLPPPPERAAELSRVLNEAQVARSQVAPALVELAAVRQSVPDAAAIDALQASITRLKSDAARNDAEIQQIDVMVARLDGEEAQADDQGLAQRVPALKGEVERAEAELARIQQQADALILLADTVQSAELANREQFLRPVMERLGPYLETVFPGAHLQLSADFDVQGLQRSAALEAINVLSRGTQEQLAVLVRLAFARLLADSNQPTPLILDDALVYTDDARLIQMFAALAQGARHHQVLVLSCHDTNFSALGGARAEITKWAGSS
jgi:hypothetical protein